MSDLSASNNQAACQQNQVVTNDYDKKFVSKNCYEIWLKVYFRFYLRIPLNLITSTEDTYFQKLILTKQETSKPPSR